MQLESPQARSIIGPLRIEEALSDLPLFGSDPLDIDALAEKALANVDSAVPADYHENDDHLASVAQAATVAEKLVELRRRYHASLGFEGDADVVHSMEPPSQRECHEKLLLETHRSSGSSKKAHAITDHIMLFRAKERYLFDFLNQSIVADDPWLRDVWAWVAGKFPRSILRTTLTHAKI